MKKLTIFFTVIVAIIVLLFIEKSTMEKKLYPASAGGKNIVNIFNWGDYVDPELIKKFEAETGYRVIYSTFDSNEAMETKIKQGGSNYDLIFPSESIIPKMLEGGLLLPFDKEKIKGTENLSPFLMNQKFDPENRYSLPYFWGTIGIMVNSKMVDINKIQAWGDLWKPEFKNSILILDGTREAIGMAMQTMGISLNETDPKKVQKAVDYFNKLRPNVKAVLTDEIKNLMTVNDAPIGIGYSGDAASVMAENPDIKYVLPKDGGAIWTDNFAIPKTAKNLEGAYAFINFMIRPENAKQNAEYVGYATPNEKAKALLPKEVTEDKTFYPDPEAMKRLEHYEYLGQDAVMMYHDFLLEWKFGL